MKQVKQFPAWTEVNYGGRIQLHGIGLSFYARWPEVIILSGELTSRLSG
jgi:hypothetical protein